MQRIRYFKTKEEGVFRSKVLKSKNGGMYQVFVDRINKTYKIKNVRQKRIIKSTVKNERGIPKNIRTVERQVRKRLKELGISFDIEIRETQND